MELKIDIDANDLAHVILEDNPTAEWNMSETHKVLNIIRKSVILLDDEDKQKLCETLSNYYLRFHIEWKPEDLTIERIGELSED